MADDGAKTRKPINFMDCGYGGICGHDYLIFILKDRRNWLYYYEDEVKLMMRKQLEYENDILRRKFKPEDFDKVVEKMYKVDVECISFFLKELYNYDDDFERPPYLNPIVFNPDWEKDLTKN